MKILTQQFFVFLTFLLCLNLFPTLQVLAAKTSCIQAADHWILQLNDNNTEVFQSHTRRNCQFSGQWVKESEHLPSGPHRERMCQDLVLIWSHKTCNFFRDVINPEAYEPCKTWSREMHQHCITNDVQWFN